MSDTEDEDGGPVTLSSKRMSEDEIIQKCKITFSCATFFMVYLLFFFFGFIVLSGSSVSLKTLIPSSPIKSENAVKVAVWILSSHARKKAPNCILQRIKWLTAIVQYGIIDSLSDIEKLFNVFLQLIFTSQYVLHMLTSLF